MKKQLDEMQQKRKIELEGGKPSFLEVVTGPRKLYRISLGMTIQALQQMTGANFFFSYGTTIFSSVGLDKPFIIQVILGAVNVVNNIPQPLHGRVVRATNLLDHRRSLDVYMLRVIRLAGILRAGAG